MEASGHESFMEELIRPYSKPSTLVDALVSFSTTVATIEAPCSFGVPNTQVVVRHNDRPSPPGMDKSPPLQVVSSIVGSYIPPPFLSPPLPTFHPSFFPNYKDGQVPGHPTPTLGIPLSTPRVLSSLVQPMGVYHHSPSPSFLSYPSTVVAPVGHAPPPPFLCHPSTMDTPVCHQSLPHFPFHPSIVDAVIHHPPPPHFPFDASTKAATIDVVSEQVVQLSAPPARDSPVWPKLFTGGITERSRLWRRVTPSRLLLSYASLEQRTTLRHIITQGASLKNRRNIEFWDAPDSGKGGNGQ